MHKPPIPALRGPTPAAGGGAGGLDWPVDLLEKARQRLQWFSLLLVLLHLVGLVTWPLFGPWGITSFPPSSSVPPFTISPPVSQPLLPL